MRSYTCTLLLAGFLSFTTRALANKQPAATERYASFSSQSGEPAKSSEAAPGKAPAKAPSKSLPAKPAPVKEPQTSKVQPAAPCAIETIKLLNIKEGNGLARMLNTSFTDLTVTPEDADHTKLDVNNPNATSGSASCNPKTTASTPSFQKLKQIVEQLDSAALSSAPVDSNFAVHVKQIGAQTVAQSLPYPTPYLLVVATSAEYLAPIPQGGVLGQGLTADAFTKQVMQVKQDLEQIDLQVGLATDRGATGNLTEQPVATKFVEALNTPNDPDAQRGVALWMARHSVMLSVLQPRDVILAFGDLFLQKGRQFVSMVSQRSVLILPASASPSDTNLLSAEALQRAVLSAQQSREKAEPPVADNNAASAANGAAQSQQAGPPERVIRLYHLRKAPDIAAAINAAVPKEHPLVTPLTDDLILILPPQSLQQDRTQEIRQVIAMLDLPRPQVSLKVWSYQISSEKKDETKRANRVQDGFTKFIHNIGRVDCELQMALAKGMAAVEKKVRAPVPGDATKGPEEYFEPDFKNYLSGHSSFFQVSQPRRSSSWRLLGGLEGGEGLPPERMFRIPSASA